MSSGKPYPATSEPDGAGDLLGHPQGDHYRVDGDIIDMTRPRSATRTVTLTANPQDVRIDLMQTAFVCIDMQNDFCSVGGWLDSIAVDTRPGKQLAPAINRLTHLCRSVGVPVIWVNWGNRADRANLPPVLLHVYNPDAKSVGLGDPLAPHASEPRAAGSRVLEKDSWGAALIDELAVSATDTFVDKYRMSGFRDTPLDSILRTLGVKTVLFGGVNVDQCVLATLMDANFLGYDTLLVEDCSATTSPDFCTAATLYNVRQCFGFSLQSNAMHEVLTAHKDHQ
ncbi:cysteine hydrolase family protein [Pararobbsia alpina]|uniref:Peroxyureidoacrylate/ureidoacrylate amidohydrolase RutB n=1 Tax=Pararobbsia alpina TaxID=621374 RepID=A0A6S7B876_9BURK|nr:isochorismatase family cysteine hydrolase [Pararobbsia alpina]CAB3791151.1 Peroxyureidoacrylate/ureidoacrylate amidohydrolase RutB [Pararobbsia alpina]